MILRERDPVEHFAPLLGPRVGLRARRPVAAAMRVPFTFKMPPSGTILVKVTLAPGAEPVWNVEALCEMGVDVEALTAQSSSTNRSCPETPKNEGSPRC